MSPHSVPRAAPSPGGAVCQTTHAWMVPDVHKRGVHCRRPDRMMPAVCVHVGAILDLCPDSAPKSLVGVTTAGRSCAHAARGQGLVQGRRFRHITIRLHDERTGRALGINLVDDPELGPTPEVAARVAAWYWRSITSMLMLTVETSARFRGRVSGNTTTATAARLSPLNAWRAEYHHAIRR